jgi:hypothetical protein
MAASDRFLAWLVTGPLGRAYGLVAEISIASWRGLTGQPQRED